MWQGCLTTASLQFVANRVIGNQRRTVHLHTDLELDALDPFVHQQVSDSSKDKVHCCGELGE